MKKLKTEIPVTILTAYQYEKGDKATNARQQIEKAGFYLQSIFNLLKSAARERESDSEDYDTQVFLADIEHLSEIGFGIAGAIFPAASELEFLGPENKPNEQTLAEQISNLLAHPDIPDELHDKIVDGLDNLGGITKHKTLTKVEKSAEYIEGVLTDYKEIREAEDE